jgi:heme exporter protein B
VRAFWTILRWDLIVELRRRESTLNMCLFAALVLFIGSYAVSARPEQQDQFGPIFFWMSIVFSGTVGLSRVFLAERENGAIHALLVAPVDPGVFYLAKVAAAWSYVMVMASLVIGAYVVLFDFDRWSQLDELFAVTGAFVLTYVSIGTLLAAMTTSLQGGEVLLRILLFPLLVPAIVTALAANGKIFTDADHPSLEVLRRSPWECVAALLALSAIYLSSCFLLFGKVVEE